MNWIKFFKSKIFLLSTLVAVIITILLLWGTLLGLNAYTHHGEKITIPNLYGYSTQNAIKELKKRKLRYTIYDSVYNKKFEAGAILNQQPQAGAVVKRNRNIFLTINSHRPEQVVFPNIKDNSLRQACEVLKINGFQIGNLQYTDNQFYNLVLFATIQNDTIIPNSKISKGSTINLILGNGNGKKIVAPNLMGKKLNRCKNILQYSGLNCGNIIFDESVITQEDSLNARVFKQTPEYSITNKINPGSNINLHLTIDELKVHLADSLLKRVINNLPIDSTLLKLDSTFLKLNKEDDRK